MKEEDFPSLKRNFVTLTSIVGAQGVLFENNALKMEVKHEYKGSSGRLAVCYTNKTAGDILHFASIVADVPFLKVQHQAPTDTIPAGAQVQHRILMECVQPFESAPGVGEMRNMSMYLLQQYVGAVSRFIGFLFSFFCATTALFRLPCPSQPGVAFDMSIYCTSPL